MSFLKETIARFNTESPRYFKKIGRIGVGLIASGVGILTPETVGVPIHIPDILTKAAGYLVTAGVVMKVTASATCANPDDLKK